ncbi:putative signal transducing protein [Lutibacter sp.]
MENNSDTLVTVLTASLIHEIHIARALLANEGINSFIFDENITTTIGTAFVDGYKLNVNVHDFDKAKQLLLSLDTDNN